MNKLNVVEEKSIILNNDCYLLETNKDMEIPFEVNGDNKLAIMGNDCHLNLSFQFNKESFSTLVVNCIGKNISIDVKGNLFTDSKLIFNYGVLASKDSINTYDICHMGDNSISELNNGGINLSKNKLYFNIDGRVNKDYKGIECRQNSKIINYQNGDSKIIPNLIIDTNEILASHSAYIGTIDKETKFYLESRGLNEEEINNLFVKSIILGKMELDEEASIFDEKIKEWWRYYE